MNKKACILALATASAIFASAAFFWLRDNKLPNFQKSAELFVLPEEDAAEVIEKIAVDNKVINRKSLERAFKAKEVAQYLKPGHYFITKSNSSVYVARMLNNGWQSPVRMTLTGNLRVKSNIAAKIACQLLIDSATVCNALNDDHFLANFGVTPKTVFSIMMPDTYDMYWTASANDILDKQKAATDAFWTKDNLDKAAKFGLTRLEVSTLASIVCSESNHEPEMPKIAGVYLNRLKLGMPLQADPTVAFCFDYKPERILKKHLEVESEYNTYKHTGLPPGPICIPTRAALEAVLNPDFGGSWGKGNLYFCANADFSGTHSFARTLSEHNANANAFRNELDRRSKARKAAARK